MTDLTALVAELNAVTAAAPDVSWDKIADTTRVMIAKAALNGGIVSYTINGRQVTHSITELREILKVAEARGETRGGGIIAQLGEFA